MDAAFNPFGSNYSLFRKYGLADTERSYKFVYVKKVTSIFLAIYLFAGSLFPGNGVAYLSEFPALLQHYDYHRTIETPGISFLDFLALHYYNKGHERSDLAHHQKLPLRHQVSTNMLDEIVYSGSLDSFCSISTRVISHSPVLEDNFIISDIGLGIFHPPKA